MEKVKKRISFAIKIAISATILFFIYSKIDVQLLAGNISQLSLFTIFILIVTSLMKHVTQGLNWYYALSINPKYQPTWIEIAQNYLIGISLCFVLPGGYATYGKMYFIENSKKATFASVLLEKFFQTWGNLIYASIAAIFFFQNVNLYLRLSVAFIIAIAPLILLLIINFIPRFKSHLPVLKTIFPKIIMSQLIYIPLTIIQYWLILRSFTEITFIQSAISTTLILSANVIPITYAGLGLREYFAIKVLGQYGISDTAAVTTALIIFIMNSVLPALVGLYFIMKYKRVDKKREERGKS